MKMLNTDLTSSNIGSDLSQRRAAHWQDSAGSIPEKLSAFPKFVDRTSLSRFLVKYEIFKHCLDVPGSIIECGVHLGGGLFTWAQLSALLEPLNHRRRVVGFDTFEGFPAIDSVDTVGGSVAARPGGYAAGSVEDIREATEIYDADRPLGQLSKIDVVAGDFMETASSYVEANPHLVVSLLYLDFDLYAPTKLALDLLVPRMPRGAVIAFDELNVPEWPGETQALVDSLGIGSLKLRRMPVSSICWAVLD